MTAIKDTKKRTKSGGVVWLCDCSCGSTVEAVAGDLKSGRTTSCGCGRKTHGMSGKIEYKTWADMRSRCNNKSHKEYKNYGGRGIKICEEWNSFEKILY